MEAKRADERGSFRGRRDDSPIESRQHAQRRNPSNRSHQRRLSGERQRNPLKHHNKVSLILKTGWKVIHILLWRHYRHRSPSPRHKLIKYESRPHEREKHRRRTRSRRRKYSYSCKQKKDRQHDRHKDRPRKHNKKSPGSSPSSGSPIRKKDAGHFKYKVGEMINEKYQVSNQLKLDWKLSRRRNIRQSTRVPQQRQWANLRSEGKRKLTSRLSGQSSDTSSQPESKQTFWWTSWKRTNIENPTAYWWRTASTLKTLTGITISH